MLGGHPKTWMASKHFCDKKPFISTPTYTLKCSFEQKYNT